MDAHAGWLAALAVDLADVPPSLLERAASKHARDSKFRPTAAELIEIARQIDQQERPTSKFTGDNRDWLNELAAKYNRAENRRPDIEWYVTNEGELKLRPTYAEQCRRVEAHNATLAARGSQIRIPMPERY